MGRLLTMGQLRERIGRAYSVAHLRRWAHAGKIPGTLKRPGKHFRFKPCPRLSGWINETTCRADNERRRAWRPSSHPEPFPINDSLTFAICGLEQAAKRQPDGLTIDEMAVAAKKLAQIERITASLQSAFREELSSRTQPSRPPAEKLPS